MHMRGKKIIIGMLIFTVCLMGTHTVSAQTDEALEYRHLGWQKQTEEQDIDGAIALYKQAIKADSKYATPYNDLGVLYEEKGLFDEAEKEYLSALQLNSNYAGVYSNLGSLYEKKGDVQRALAYWEKRSKMGDPDNVWTLRALDKVNELSIVVAEVDAIASEGSETVAVTGAGVEAPQKKPLTEKERAMSFADMMADEAKTEWKSGRREKKRVTNAAKRKERDKKRRIKKLLSEAKNNIYDERYQGAVDMLYEAKSISDKVAFLDELIDEARSRNIDYEIARAAVNADLYKKAQFIEIENAWYPPVPEVEAVKGYEDTFKGVTKSPARLELERKAQQIISSIDFTEARLKEVIEFLAVSNDINIVIDETVVPRNETVTIHLKNIPLQEALDIILRTKGLKYRFEENIIWITTEEKLLEEDLVVRVYDVQDLVGKLFDFPSIPFDFESNLELGDETSE